jgi:hypothetical protein
MGILYKIGIPSTFEKVTKNILVYLAFTMIAILWLCLQEFITFVPLFDRFLISK